MTQKLSKLQPNLNKIMIYSLIIKVHLNNIYNVRFKRKEKSLKEKINESVYHFSKFTHQVINIIVINRISVNVVVVTSIVGVINV